MKAVNPCGLKRAALINDLSCFGKCSLSVSMPILSSFGVETVPLPTAILSTHTGGFTGFVVQDMTENMRLFAAHWKKLGVKFDAIITGYCCTVEQIKLTAEFIRSFSDTDTLVIVDPVLGDHEALYTGLLQRRRNAFICAAGQGRGHYQRRLRQPHRLSGAAGRTRDACAEGKRRYDRAWRRRCVYQRAER